MSFSYLKRLRDLREDADLNQTQVAKMLGMSPTRTPVGEHGPSQRGDVGIAPYSTTQIG